MTHPSQQQLLEFTQRALDPIHSSDLNAHIAVCERCAAIHQAMSRVEGALTAMRPESPSSGFERNVMHRLGLRDAGSLWWYFLKNFSPVLVAGILIGVIVSFGSAAPDSSGSILPDYLGDTGRIREVLLGFLGGFSAGIGSVLQTYLSPLVKGGEGNLSVFLIFLFAGIGLLDKFIVGPMVRRRR